MIRRWLWIAIILWGAISVIAQESACPTLQLDALAAIDEFCDEQEPDTLCFGNPTVSMTYIDDSEDDLRFTLPGDRIPLTVVDWFSTSSESSTWGTTRAFLHAYPTDSLNPQPVTLIVFGNTMLFNQGTEGISIETVDVEVTVQQGANVRALPSSDVALLEPVIRGTLLKASGRSDDGSWVRVYTDRDQLGWVNVAAISDEYTDLPVVSPDDEPDELVLPMQAFNFQSAISDAACDGAPPSGILLQSSKEGDATAFYINGITLEVKGTAFLQAQPEAGMLVHITDGVGQIIALDGEATIEAGYVSRIFLDTDDDGNLYPIEVPSIPLVYDYEMLVNLPVDLLANPSRVGIDIYTLITPRPVGGESPIAGMALDAPCKFTVGQTGANIRSAPDPEASIIAVMGYRESAEPVARTIGADSMPWWKLAEGVWIRIDTTVTGGDCTSVPTIQFEG